MRSGKNYWSILTLSLMMLLVISTGCSNLSPLSSNQTDSPAGNTSNYPPITDELLLNGPAPGYHILTMERPPSMMGIENWDRAEAFLMQREGGSVLTQQGSGCVINPWTLPSDMWITVTLPEVGYAIVDFGPHPLQFSRGNLLVLDMDGTEWEPSGSDIGGGGMMNPGGKGGGAPVYVATPEDIAIFYYNEETGEYEEYLSMYDPVENALVCWTDHFSRYIIAGRD